MYKFTFDVVRNQFYPGPGQFVLVFSGDGVRQGSRELKANDGEPKDGSFEVSAEKNIDLTLSVIAKGGGKRVLDTFGLPVFEAAEMYADGKPIQRSLATGWDVVLTSIDIPIEHQQQVEESSEGDIDQPDTEVLNGGDSELEATNNSESEVNSSESNSESETPETQETPEIDAGSESTSDSESVNSEPNNSESISESEAPAQ